MIQVSQVNVTAVIPVKALTEAKSRLAKVLGPARRQGLVIDMLQHVLRIVRGSRVHRLLVVTCDRAVGAVVSAEGAEWISDPADTLNASLSEVFRGCWERRETPLYLPADLPRLGVDDVDGLIDAWGGKDRMVLSPSRDEQGTNALLVPATCRMEPMLGTRSFPRHLAQAERSGISTNVHRTAGIALDIDTPEDLLLVSGHAHRNPEVPAR